MKLKCQNVTEARSVARSGQVPILLVALELDCAMDDGHPSLKASVARRFELELWSENDDDDDDGDGDIPGDPFTEN